MNRAPYATLYDPAADYSFTASRSTWWWLKPEGRDSRRVYWALQLPFPLAMIALVALIAIASGSPLQTAVALLSIPLGLVGIYLSIVTTIRRAHDLGKSGWWLLLLAVPFIGFVFGLYLAFWPGMREPNDFGNPRAWGKPQESPATGH